MNERIISANINICMNACEQNMREKMTDFAHACQKVIWLVSVYLRVHQCCKFAATNCTGSNSPRFPGRDVSLSQKTWKRLAIVGRCEWACHTVSYETRCVMLNHEEASFNLKNRCQNNGNFGSFDVALHTEHNGARFVLIHYCQCCGPLGYHTV